MTIERASDNPFPSVLFVEGDPEDLAANPASGQRRLAVGTDHLLYLVDDAGDATVVGGSSGLADPMTTRGDMIYRNASNVTARLAIPAAGQVIGRVGSDLGSLYPPGYEFDYVQKTSNTTVTQTSEASADTVVTANAVTYDGSTIIVIEFFSPTVRPATGGGQIDLWIFDGSSSIGKIGSFVSPAAAADNKPCHVVRRLTPSAAAHTYSIRATVDTGSGLVAGAAGGAATNFPAFIRQFKV